MHDFHSDFKFEVGKTNAYIHAHCYVGIEHNMKVQLDRAGIQQYVLSEINAQNFGANAFGDPLSGIFVGRINVIKYKQSLDEGHADWREYVDKEMKDNQTYFEKIDMEQAKESVYKHSSIQRNSELANYMERTNRNDLDGDDDALEDLSGDSSDGEGYTLGELRENADEEKGREEEERLMKASKWRRR